MMESQAEIMLRFKDECLTLKEKLNLEQESREYELSNRIFAY